MSATSLETVRDFLAQKRWAVAGVSRRRLDFSRWLLGQLRQRGYEAIPVNPNAVEIDGQRCYARIPEIEPAPGVVLLMTPPRLALTLARDCEQAGVRRVWFYAAAGRGAASPEAIEFCRSRGMSVIAGLCPIMFFEDAGWLHRVHAGALKLFGRYPATPKGLKPEADSRR
jgi:predicted CoA-binding protein